MASSASLLKGAAPAVADAASLNAALLDAAASDDASAVLLGDAKAAAPGDSEDLGDANNAPRMSPLGVYFLFLKFGVRAFGGPVSQIADQKEELVVKGRWISEARFKRVFSLYSCLPGPEATELACYFGTLAGGRVGGLMGGLGFITPGFSLMLGAAWFYAAHGLGNAVFQAVFAGLQPAMCALVVRACHKMGDNAVRNHASRQVDEGLLLVAFLAALSSVMGVNYFIAKAHLAVLYLCLHAKRRNLAIAVGVLPVATYVALIFVTGKPMDSVVPMGVGVGKALGNTYGAQFVVGLLGGLVTFGGAYTAIPFIQYETVTSGAWIASQVFLDSLAVCSVLPTPLVMFVTMVGYNAGYAMSAPPQAWQGLVAAVLMTVGLMLPAFAFPVLLHKQLEAAVKKQGTFARVLDALAATVVGQIAVTSLQLLRTSVTKPLDAVIFVGALLTAYGLPHKFTPVLIVACAAMAGQVLFY